MSSPKVQKMSEGSYCHSTNIPVLSFVDIYSMHLPIFQTPYLLRAHASIADAYTNASGFMSKLPSLYRRSIMEIISFSASSPASTRSLLRQQLISAVHVTFFGLHSVSPSAAGVSIYLLKPLLRTVDGIGRSLLVAKVCISDV